MNRRGFLNLLGIGAATAAVDPERLLWTPTKKIFIPAPRQPILFKNYSVSIPVTLDEINRLTLKYMGPNLVKSVFEDDPFLEYLRSTDPYLAEWSKESKGLYEPYNYEHDDHDV